jgi:hypothetical protein
MTLSFFPTTTKKITPQTILDTFNKQHAALHFTLTEKNINQITYLDLKQTNNNKTYKWTYRTSTTIDTVIYKVSCHQQKKK